MSKKNCSICCEDTSKIIICIHCNFEGCQKCVKTYLFQSINDANCPNCKKNWDRENLRKYFSDSFINKEYKLYRENVLYERQLSMMEETMNIALYRKEKDKLRNNYEQITLTIKRLMKEREKFLININEKSVKRLIKNKCKTNEEFYLYHINEAEYYKTLVENNEINIITDEIKKSEFEKFELFTLINSKKEDIVINKFFGHCPMNNCKGFINSHWCCGLCDTKVCKSCKEQLSENHVCDPNVILSLESIKKSSKPCPKCKAYITKLEGCSQMWCTNCHVAFDWKTGEIENKNIHNPHYTDWLNKVKSSGVNVINERFNLCEIDALNMNVANDITSHLRIPIRKRYMEIMRILNHIQRVELLRYNTNEDLIQLDYRIDYILNKIDKIIFKRKLQMLEKKCSKQKEISQIYNTLIDICKMTIQNLNILIYKEVRGGYVYENVSEDKIILFNNIFKELINETNKNFENISIIFNGVAPYINDTSEKIIIN